MFGYHGAFRIDALSFPPAGPAVQSRRVQGRERAAAPPAPRFSRAERTVIACFSGDPISSIEVRWWHRIAETVFSWRRCNALADPRLEALRRAAVLARHGRFLSSAEHAAFMAAGFSEMQARTLDQLARSGIVG